MVKVVKPPPAARDGDANLLQVANLSIDYASPRGTVHAVNDLSFSVAEAEAVAFVGESGCGKSATALAMVQLLPREGHVGEGEVWFRGRDLLLLSEADMRSVRGAEIGMVFQDPMTSLNPTLTIGLQISEAIEAHSSGGHRAAQQRAIELLEWVGIPSASSRYKQYPHEFSGGMRQRVMIAMALSCQPRLLIADEPTTALDVTIQAQILDLLLRLRTELKMAIILITHDLAVAAQLAERIHVMYAGQIVEVGRTHEIFAGPRHPYTIGLLESIPRLDRPRRKLIPIDGSPPDLVAPQPGCPFAPRCRLAVQDCWAANPALLPLEVSLNHRVACWVNGPQARAVSSGPAGSCQP